MTKTGFDEGIKKLEEIISLLEDPKTPLEKAFELYKEARGLAGYLREKIDKMEKDIRVVENDDTGT